jgi:TPR repeat protein
VNKEIEVSQTKRTKKSGLVTVVWMISLVVIATMVILWKNHTDTQKSIVSNRVIASKNSKLGTPFPENFDQIIDLNLLKEDAKDGNLISKEALKLYLHRNTAAEFLTLGVPTPEKAPTLLDLNLLRADGGAGNPNAQIQLALMVQRELLHENIKLGKEFPPNIIDQLDTELLTQDASAGNSQVENTLWLLENRTKAKKLCVLGKPFSLDFYDHVDREILQNDADAGYLPSKEILKLADNRINAEKFTIVYKPYPKDFFEQVDKELLIADADAGNSEMQYIWARTQHDLFLPVDNTIVKKYYAMSAAQNNPRAQYGLGHYYQNAKGEERDYARAAEFYKLAIEQGDLPAMSHFSLMLSKGQGVKQDIEGFKVILKKAAEGDDAMAQYSLGSFLCEGTNWHEKDSKEGIEWLKKSCDQDFIPSIRQYTIQLQRLTRSKELDKMIYDALRKGAEYEDPYCMVWYGRKLIRGRGVKKDSTEGFNWVQKAIDAGGKDGMTALADMLKDNLISRRDRLNDDETAELYKILAEKGHTTSMNNLGSFYMYGARNIKPNYKLAAKYIHMYLNSTGHVRGIKNGEGNRTAVFLYGKNSIDLGVLYRDGKGVEQDFQKAIQHFEMALKTKHFRANEVLGDLYSNYPEHGIQDFDKMIYHYTEGARDGCINCQNKLGVVYEKGKIVPRDIDLATNYYEQARNKNNAISLYSLGHIYGSGKYAEIGAKKDVDKAKEFYRKSIKAGYKPAAGAIRKLEAE